MKPRLHHFKKIFKEEDTRFFMAVGFKVASISFSITLVMYYIVYLVLRLNYGFFVAHGQNLIEREPFFEYVTSEALDTLPIVFGFHVCLFFIGVYVGWLILRPFRVIGKYCEEVLENPNIPYQVDEFSNFRLLTGFSAFFFEYLRESRRKGELSPQSIPPQYQRIHKPQFDLIFLLHFGLLLVIIAISSCVFLVETITSISSSVIELAQKTLSNPKIINKFFAHQTFILDEIILVAIILIAISYLTLGFHLYGKVSGASFGIFSTMRSFMKGGHFSRVHLVGYSYIRDNTRKLNKYLDYVQTTLTKDKTNS